MGTKSKTKIDTELFKKYMSWHDKFEQSNPHKYIDRLVTGMEEHLLGDYYDFGEFNYIGVHLDIEELESFSRIMKEDIPEFKLIREYIDMLKDYEQKKENQNE